MLRDFGQREIEPVDIVGDRGGQVFSFRLGLYPRQRDISRLDGRSEVSPYFRINGLVAKYLWSLGNYDPRDEAVSVVAEFISEEDAEKNA